MVAEAPQPGRSRAELVVDYAEVGVTHLQVRVDGDLNVARDEIHELETINLG